VGRRCAGWLGLVIFAVAVFLCQSPIRQSLSLPRIISVISFPQVVLCFFPVALLDFLPAWRSAPFYPSGFILRIPTPGYWDGL